MGERFSKDYAVDPRNCDWGGEAYSFLYSKELIDGVLEELGLAPTHYDEVRAAVLGACAVYEMGKRNVLEFQKSHQKERDAQTDFAKKAVDFLESFHRLRTTGKAFSDTVFQVQESLAKEGVTGINFKIPDMMSILQLAVWAARAGTNEKETYRRTPKSQKYTNWVLNLSPLFRNSPVPLSVGSYYVSNEKVKSILVLHKLILPLDPEVEEQQIAEAVKRYVRDHKANQSLGKIEAESA